MQLGIFITIGIVSLLGLTCALFLGISQKTLGIKEDQKLKELISMLPGVNCGACGFPGCSSFAKALLYSFKDSLFCPVSNSEKWSEIMKFLRKEIKQGEKLKATVLCKGTIDVCKYNTYGGIQSCLLVKKTGISIKDCEYGCVGAGDCLRACPFDAIEIQNGVAHVIDKKCVGCGKCVKACPFQIINMYKDEGKIFVACNSRDKARKVLQVCKVGCIGCGKCVKTCPVGAITLENNLAYINPFKCTLCSACVKVCPTKAIKKESVKNNG